MPPNGAKTLLFDIESSPLVTYTWGTYQQDVIKVIEEWYMLTFSWKWLGGKQTFVRGLPDYPEYKKNPKNDYYLVQELHQLFEVADIIVAHNLSRFDDKKSSARFLYHGFSPPAPYKKVDTLQVARKHFALTSNKLDGLGEHLGVGRKVQTGGFDLWLGCMNGDMKSWDKMKKYNKQDVILLEKVYLKLRPWITNHPNVGLMDDRPKACNNCGSQKMHKHSKKSYAKTGWKYQYKCNNCGSYQIGSKLHKFDEKLI